MADEFNEIPDPSSTDTAPMPEMPASAPAPVAAPQAPTSAPTPAQSLVGMPDIAAILGPRPTVPMPAPPPIPGPVSQDPHQQVLSALVAGIIAAAGRHSGFAPGAADGLAKVQQGLQQAQAQKYAQQHQEYQQAAGQAMAAQKQMDADLQKRENAVRSTLLNFKTDLAKTTTEEQYNSLVSSYSNAFQAAGFRTMTPQWFFENYKFVPPTDQKVLGDAIDKAMARVKAAGGDLNSIGAITYTSPTTKQQVRMSLPDAYKALGVELKLDANGNPIQVPIGKGSEYDQHRGIATQEYTAKFGHAPTPGDAEANNWVTNRIGELAGQAAKPLNDRTMTIKTMQNGQPVELVVPETEALKHGAYPSQPPTAITVAKANEATANQPIPVGSAEYKIAQDLAYGKLTFQQFRSLYSYSRDNGKKTAIYQQAGELNPHFNPAEFEAGQKLASNPKTRQQLASLDNVLVAVPDLIKVSDQASRSGVTALNALINRGGYLIGGQHYANLQTARVAFADELSGALGFGSASDMSREMGFNMTDANLSPDNFKSALQDIVVPFVIRKRDTLLKQMGPLGQSNVTAGTNPAVAPPAAGTGAPSYQDYLRSRGK